MSWTGPRSDPLYASPQAHFNPSTSGDRVQEEIAVNTKKNNLAGWLASVLSLSLCLPVQEAMRWVNQRLAAAGHSDQLITDLSTDMADGVSLLLLVQALGQLASLVSFRHAMQPAPLCDTLELNTVPS